MDIHVESILDVLREYGLLPEVLPDGLEKDLKSALACCDEYLSYSVNSGRSMPDPEKMKLKAENYRMKHRTLCDDCKGLGRMRDYGPSHFADYQCPNCYGQGYVYPSEAEVQRAIRG